jgi:ring-1,2-phenylacetyl-CoA epoxidase subunit PaaA
MLALASGTDEQFEMLQEAVDRWWEPMMHFFGTDVAAEDDPMIHWGIKTRTNEESRQEWINTSTSRSCGTWASSCPTRRCATTPTPRRWDYTEPDWDELARIVKGEPDRGDRDAAVLAPAAAPPPRVGPRDRHRRRTPVAA